MTLVDEARRHLTEGPTIYGTLQLVELMADEIERLRTALREIEERLDPPWTDYSVRQAQRIARAALKEGE